MMMMMMGLASDLHGHSTAASRGH